MVSGHSFASGRCLGIFSRPKEDMVSISSKDGPILTVPISDGSKRALKSPPSIMLDGVGERFFIHVKTGAPFAPFCRAAWFTGGEEFKIGEYICVVVVVFEVGFSYPHDIEILF